MTRDEAIYRAMMNGIGRVRSQAVPAFTDTLAASGYAVVPADSISSLRADLDDAERTCQLLTDELARVTKELQACLTPRS